jgi:predicted phage terminase large subunit-like protein
MTPPAEDVRTVFTQTLAERASQTVRGSFVPHDGPQRAFVDSDADIVIYGGAAGGGKTAALLMTPVLKGHTNNSGFGAVIFRRILPDIKAAGGMWDESEVLYEPFGAVSRQDPLERCFPSGAKVTFAHLQHKKDRLHWKGSQIAYLAFDQLEEFEESQFWYLTSRNRSTCGVRPYIRATVNPDPDSWVKAFLAPWVDDRHPEYPFPPGEVRYFTRDGDSLVWVDADWRDPDGQPATSLTYIPATIHDNPTLLAGNPEYLARLETVGRSWDLAGTVERDGADPDWTVGAKVGYLDGVWYVLDIVRARASPAGVDRLMDQTALLDGASVEIHLQQDPGEVGQRAVEGHVRRLKGHVVRWRRPTGDKVTRAKPLASAAEAGNVVLVSGFWNRDFSNECVAFPGNGHDDQVDAVSWAFLVQAFPNGDSTNHAPIPVGSGPESWIAIASMKDTYDKFVGKRRWTYGDDDDDDIGAKFRRIIFGDDN